MNENIYAPVPTTPETTWLLGARPGIGVVEALGCGARAWTGSAARILPLVLLIGAPFALVEGLAVEAVATRGPGAITLVSSLVGTLKWGLLAPAVIFPMVEQGAGRAPSLWDSLRFAARRFWPTLLARLMASVQMTLGFVCLLIPGFYLTAAYAAADVVVAIEPESRPLPRCRELVRGRLRRAGAVVALGWAGTFLSLWSVSQILPTGAGAEAVRALVVDTAQTFSLALALILTLAFRRELATEGAAPPTSS